MAGASLTVNVSAKIDGATLIFVERQRQITGERYTPAHDRDAHEDAELAMAAATYCILSKVGDGTQSCFGPPEQRTGYMRMAMGTWPWSSDELKPAGHLRNLVKAGALIAAEIDRLQGTRPTAGLPGLSLQTPAEGDVATELVQELVKVAAQYSDLAGQLLPQVGGGLPGIAHNKRFADEWGAKALAWLQGRGRLLGLSGTPLKNPSGPDPLLERDRQPEPADLALNDTVTQWLRDCCAIGGTYKRHLVDLHPHYAGYCAAKGLEALPCNPFADRLRAMPDAYAAELHFNEFRIGFVSPAAKGGC